MADDIAALIDHLGLDRPDPRWLFALWRSSPPPVPRQGRKARHGLGARLAKRHPGRDARPQDQVNAAAAEFMKETPMYEAYQKVAPRPDDFGRLLDKIGESMAKDFDFSEEVRALKVPTLIVAADADMAPPSHYIEVFKLLDGGLRRGCCGRAAPRRACTCDPARPYPLQPRRLFALIRTVLILTNWQQLS